MTKIFAAPIYKLEELNNLFIELTAHNCNQKCQSCYINFPTNKKVKDFIPFEKIKEAVSETIGEELHCIYLTGAEPMMHPDFNAILRFLLKRSNVCICTNASFLNEKKVRFLKKVEDEQSNHQIFFRVSLTHFDELENDKTKYRGNFRQTIFALKTLSRYNFTSVLAVQNFYNLKENILLENFVNIFNQHEINNTEIVVFASYPNFDDKNYLTPSKKTDCMYGRVLANTGIYSCPFLAGDYRGRVGSSFKDYSKTISAETDFCATCSKNNNTIFTICELS